VFLICKLHSGVLSIVDTHQVSVSNGGHNTAVVVSSGDQSSAVPSLCNWLMRRIGWKDKVCHELTVMKPSSGQPATDADQCSLHADNLSAGDNCAMSIHDLSFHTGSNNCSSGTVNSQLNEVPCVMPVAEDQQYTEGNDVTEMSVTEGSDISVEYDTEDFSDVDCDNITETDHEMPAKQKLRKYARYKKQELSIEKWNEVLTEEVMCLPYDIDGLRKFQIPCNFEEMMHATKDGRPWGLWTSSSCTGFLGCRRVARCKGMPQCQNLQCPYFLQYGNQNRVQFHRKNGLTICFSCGIACSLVECPSVKVWEYAKGGNSVVVMHKG